MAQRRGLFPLRARQEFAKRAVYRTRRRAGTGFAGKPRKHVPRAEAWGTRDVWGRLGFAGGGGGSRNEEAGATQRDSPIVPAVYFADIRNHWGKEFLKYPRLKKFEVIY